MKKVSPTKSCAVCGVIITSGYDRNAFKRAKYCSLKCYWKSLKDNKLHFKPELHTDKKILCVCGCGTIVPFRDQRGRKRKYVVGHTMKGVKRIFSKNWLEKIRSASIKVGKLHRGKNHWNWQGGKTPYLQNLRHGRKYSNWRKAVYTRDNSTCQMCHIKQEHPLAHHKKAFDKYPKLRFEVSNGMTLCRSCHKKVHKEIGTSTRFD